MFETFFTGEQDITIDDRYRVVLPARFRDRLATGVFVAKGEERCAAIYPRDTYAAKAAAVMGRGTGKAADRGLTRTFFSAASEQQVDKQGRVLLNERIRKFAGLTREVTVIGAGDHLEIWDRRAWGEYQAREDERFATREEA